MKLLTVPIHELAKKRFEIVRVLVELGVQFVLSIRGRFGKPFESFRASVAISRWSRRAKHAVRLVGAAGVSTA